MVYFVCQTWQCGQSGGCCYYLGRDSERKAGVRQGRRAGAGPWDLFCLTSRQQVPARFPEQREGTAGPETREDIRRVNHGLLLRLNEFKAHHVPLHLHRMTCFCSHFCLLSCISSAHRLHGPLSSTNNLCAPSELSHSPKSVLLLPSARRPAAPVRLPQFQALPGQAHTCPSPTSQWSRPGIACDCPGALVFCVQCMVLSLFPSSLQLCRASPFWSVTDHMYDVVPGDSITQ